MMLVSWSCQINTTLSIFLFSYFIYYKFVDKDYYWGVSTDIRWRFDTVNNRIVAGYDALPADENYVGEQLDLLENHEAFVNHIVNVMQNTTKIVDDLSKIEGPFLKIAICNMIDDTKVIMQYLEHLQEMFGAEIKVVTSGNIWIDFIAPGTNKGAALSNLMKLFHVKPEECMAFGDQYNDLEMLELVGHSYAMSNSAPGVSYYADEVTDSVEDVLEDVLASLYK